MIDNLLNNDSDAIIEDDISPTIATRKIGVNAKGNKRKLTRLRQSLIDDNDEEETNEKANKKSMKSSISSGNMHLMNKDSMIPIYQGQLKLLQGQKTGNRGKLTAIKNNNHRSNIVPSYADIDRFHSTNIINYDPFYKLRKDYILEKFNECKHSWLWSLQCNHNILIYGIGCKKYLLKELAREFEGQDCILINGDNDINSERAIKDILEYICVNILQRSEIMTRYNSIITATYDIVEELNKFYQRSNIFKKYECNPYEDEIIVDFHQVQRNIRLVKDAMINVAEKDKDEDSEPDISIELLANNLPSVSNALQSRLSSRAISNVIAPSSKIHPSKLAQEKWGGRYRHEKSMLYILVNSIEGKLFQMNDAKVCLSILASCPSIGIIATCEHMNTSLQWNQEVLCNFKWIFEHFPTFEPNHIESDYILFPQKKTDSSIALRKTDSKSIDSVLLSFPKKHRELLVLLINETLKKYESLKNNVQDGKLKAKISGDDYKISKREILVLTKKDLRDRTESALNETLKEFVDQNLLSVSKDDVRLLLPIPKLRDILAKLKTYESV